MRLVKTLIKRSPIINQLGLDWRRPDDDLSLHAVLLSYLQHYRSLIMLFKFSDQRYVSLLLLSVVLSSQCLLYQLSVVCHSWPLVHHYWRRISGLRVSSIPTSVIVQA